MIAKHDRPKHLPEGACSTCWKVGELCICSELKPTETRRHVLVLQHPKETRSPLGTARLVSLLLPDSNHRIGLSWKGLPAALKVEKEAVDTKQWAVLYLGPKKKAKPAKPGKDGKTPAKAATLVATKPQQKDTRPFRLEKSDGTGISVGTVRGLIVLDGNWKQAKALWWRNPWLNRLPRLTLNPNYASQYGMLRRQARRQGLSTLEAVASGLEALGEAKKTTELLRDTMEVFISRASFAPVSKASVDFDTPFEQPRAPESVPNPISP